MGAIPPTHPSSQPDYTGKEQSATQKGGQQLSWILKAFFAFLHIEVEKGEITPQQAQKIESSLKHLQGQLNEVTTKEELRALFQSLNNEVGIVNKQMQKLDNLGKGKQILLEAELVEPGRERSASLSQVSLFENFLNQAAELGLIDPTSEAQLWENTKSLWEAVENGTLTKPDEIMAKLHGIVKNGNQILPEGFQFPEPPLDAYTD